MDGLRTTEGRKRLATVADVLAVAIAVSLPWSTSVTGILVGLWFFTSRDAGFPLRSGAGKPRVIHGGLYR